MKFPAPSSEKVTDVPPRAPVATIAEVVGAGIHVLGNNDPFGIPQGTPISAALSNAYMMPLDKRIVEARGSVGGLYRRYSDDILKFVTNTFLFEEVIEGFELIDVPSRFSVHHEPP
jgi:hypothetical protein